MFISAEELRSLEESVEAALEAPAAHRQQILHLVEKRLREEQRRATPDSDTVGTLFGLCIKLRESLGATVRS
jgi:hypothetical protein